MKESTKALIFLFLSTWFGIPIMMGFDMTYRQSALVIMGLALLRILWILVQETKRTRGDRTASNS